MRKVEAGQDALGVGQVTDDFANGRRPCSHDRRHGDDLVVNRDLRILHQIDDLDMVASGEMFFADLLEIAEGGG